MKHIYSVLLVLVSCSLVQAGYSSKKCWKEASNTNQNNYCASMDFERANGNLEKATANLIFILKKVTYATGDKAAADILLDVVTRNQSTFKQAAADQCILESEIIGGTGMTAEILGCQTKEMKKRTLKYNSLSKEYSE